MTASIIDSLPPNRRADVLAAVTSLEAATEPLLPNTYRALAEPVLREVVEQVLAAAGRVLVRAGTGFISGYDDTITARLAAEGVGILRPDDRAVLTAVLLFSVAIPRAEGKIARDAPWTQGRPVSRERLADTRIPAVTITSALQRLQDAEIVRAVQGGIVPGPQFHRLTPAASTAVFDGLILLAEPDGALADAVLRRRRAQAADSAALVAPHPKERSSE